MNSLHSIPNWCARLIAALKRQSTNFGSIVTSKLRPRSFSNNPGKTKVDQTMNLKSKLADLFRATERAHISAHNHTKDESPDWSFWFAEKLQAPLRSEFKIKLTKSEIVHCLMQSEMEHLARAPQDDWAEFYAAFFLERHATGDGSRETLALYYYETCPFCGLVLNEIDRLGVEDDHRHVLKNPNYR